MLSRRRSQGRAPVESIRVPNGALSWPVSLGKQLPEWLAARFRYHGVSANYRISRIGLESTLPGCPKLLGAG
jgi:hypothetical protein